MEVNEVDELLKVLLEMPEETQTVEFKRLDGTKVVAKIIQTMVAFANTDGGWIVIGVDDPEKTKLKGVGRIFGIEENKDLYDEVLREAQRIIPDVPAVPLTIVTSEINKTVVVLKIPKATLNFHSIDKKVFVRLHKSNKQLSPQEFIKMSYAKGFEKADRELVDVDFSLLKTDLYEDWRSTREIDGKIEDTLFKTGLARKERGKLLPTRAAVLLFAEFPTNLMETKCAVRVMQYTGRIETYQEVPNMIGAPKTIGGPVTELIRKTHEYVLTLLREGIEIHSGFVTKYLIPERSVKEAITNAVIHRDYYIKRDIEIKIFEDRVEIISPGLFPYNITKQNIGLVRAEGYRNDLLVKHMREFFNPPNLDQNEGVVAMRNEMKARGLYLPIFITYPTLLDSVDVVLFNEHTPAEWEKVKEFLETNRYIANREAREITGIVQLDKMSKMLSKWVKQGLLIKISPDGSAKKTKYKLADRIDIDDKR